MVILKGIPRILSPQLLSVIARMGHGDEIGMYIFPCYNPKGVVELASCLMPLAKASSIILL